MIENEELLEKAPTWHYGLGSVIESSFPDIANHLSYIRNRLYNASYNKEHASIRKYSNLTFYMIDGKPTNEDTLALLAIEEIKSVELLKKT